MDRLDKRDDALDAVKGFAILIVMLGHCIVLNGLQDPYVYDAIAAVQMPLFMVVSGFIAGRGPLLLMEKPDGKRWLVKLQRRSLSYLLPFFVWLFLTHLTNPFEELKLQLFALDRGLWFLMTLWIVTLVTMTASYGADYCGWKCSGKPLTKSILRFVVFCVIVGIFYLGFMIQGRSGNNFLSPSLTVRYLPFYVAGYLWAAYVMPLIRQRTASGAKGKLMAYLPWFIALAAFLYLIAVYDMIVVTDTKSLLAQMTASFLGSYVCFYGIYHFAGGRIKKGLSLIGQYTLEIYVLHFRFARLLGIGEKGLQVYSLQAVGWIAAAFAVMSVLTALCIFVIKKIRILDLLLFGKSRSR